MGREGEGEKGRKGEREKGRRGEGESLCDSQLNKKG
jgi:hypothetical protein